jgi:hypothetical protein
LTLILLVIRIADSDTITGGDSIGKGQTQASG